jgi:INO80 complex subunit C
LKTVLTQEREREKQDRERRRLEREEAMDVDGVLPPGPSNAPFEEDTPTCKPVCLEGPSLLSNWRCDIDTSIEAPPSLLPARKYCDITGLEARTHSARGLT